MSAKPESNPVSARHRTMHCRCYENGNLAVRHFMAVFTFWAPDGTEVYKENFPHEPDAGPYEQADQWGADNLGWVGPNVPKPGERPWLGRRAERLRDKAARLQQQLDRVNKELRTAEAETG